MSQPAADKVATDPAPVSAPVVTTTPADTAAVSVATPAVVAPAPAATPAPVPSDVSGPAPATDAPTPAPTSATDAPAQESTATTPSPAPSVTVVLSKPQTTAEMIAARALKRAARRSAVREKAEGFKRAGDLLFESRKYKAAYPHYLEAIQLWSSNPEYFISLAGVYRKLQWYEEAAYAATRALTLMPSNTTARYIRGVARMEQRLLHPAKLDFETVLAHEPGHLLARAALTEVTHFISVSTTLGNHTLGANPNDVVVTADGTGTGIMGAVDFGYPKFEDEGLEVDSGSDSSDWNHVGNGVQCRFYNHEGCKRGSECVFSHAPDEKSVRDELGRNVCTYHLLSACKFGSSKCIYSHARDALPPRGWWTSEAQIAKAKEMMEAAEKRNREERAREREERERRRKEREEKKAAAKKEKGGEKGKEGEEKVEGQQEGEAKETTAEASAPKKKSGPTPAQGQGQKRKQQTRRKKPAGAAVGTAAAATTTPAAPTTTGEILKERAAEGFTEYRLNVQPRDEVVEPDTSIVLSY